MSEGAIEQNPSSMDRILKPPDIPIKEMLHLSVSGNPYQSSLHVCS